MLTEYSYARNYLFTALETGPARLIPLHDTDHLRQVVEWRG